MKNSTTALLKFIQLSRSYEIFPSESILLWFLCVCWFKSRKKNLNSTKLFVKKQFETVNTYPTWFWDGTGLLQRAPMRGTTYADMTLE